MSNQPELIDPTMEVISAIHNSAIVYRIFSDGFLAEWNRDSQVFEQEIEDIQYEISIFKHEENAEWVLWVTDLDGAGDYVEDFWLIFAEDKEAVARHACALLIAFFKGNGEDFGRFPPSTIYDRLQSVFEEIWGQKREAHNANVPTNGVASLEEVPAR